MNDEFIHYVRDFVDMLSWQAGLEGIIILDADANTLYEKRWVEDYPRDIYSNTKSFTSAAVGVLVENGRLSLDDRPVDLLEAYRFPVDSNPYWEKLRLKDLLTMRSGFAKPHLMYFDRRNGQGANDYAAYMAAQELSFAPGTHYLYSSGDLILAGCMAEAACGTSLRELLYHSFFEPADIGFPIWESDMNGHSCGASGLSLKLKDMAKLGVLYLNEGCYNGKRIFSDDWVRQSFQPHVSLQKGYTSWGYGLSWTISRDRQIYSARGVFGQNTFVIPSLNLVLATQCREGARFIETLYDALQTFFAG